MLFSETIPSKKLKIYIFLKHFKFKGTIILNSSDLFLSSESEDVCTDSLAQSVREVWLIVSSKGTQVLAVRGRFNFKHFSSLITDFCFFMYKI